MIKSIPGICFLSFVVLLSGCTSSDQIRLDRTWPVKYGSRSHFQAASVREGFILKKNGDTLKGYVKMVTEVGFDDTVADVALLPVNKKSGTDILHVKPKDIDYIRLKIRPNGAVKQDYMLIHSRLWEILGRNDQAILCFRKIEISFHDISDPYSYNDQLLLLRDNWIIAIPPEIVNNSQSHVAALQTFIRGRYDNIEDFPGSNLKNEKEMIRYILMKEQQSSKWRIPGPYYPYRLH